MRLYFERGIFSLWDIINIIEVILLLLYGFLVIIHWDLDLRRSHHHQLGAINDFGSGYEARAPFVLDFVDGAAEAAGPTVQQWAQLDVGPVGVLLRPTGRFSAEKLFQWTLLYNGFCIMFNFFYIFQNLFQISFLIAPYEMFPDSGFFE